MPMVYYRVLKHVVSTVCCEGRSSRKCGCPRDSWKLFGASWWTGIALIVSSKSGGTVPQKYQQIASKVKQKQTTTHVVSTKFSKIFPLKTSRMLRRKNNLIATSGRKRRPKVSEPLEAPIPKLCVNEHPLATCTLELSVVTFRANESFAGPVFAHLRWFKHLRAHLCKT